MKLLKDIKSNGTSILLISHDLGLVGEYADEISVMYSGRVVENARTREFFENTTHPYSKALLLARPSNAVDNVLKTIDGQPPSIKERILGCRFSPRCELCEADICKNVPTLRCINPEHYVACHKV
jgi:oligopeptide/dipeptide ABC transporter ATP-binding protein